ncbi:transcription termination/antitermination protein NusA [Candidatus Peregrinibacteria bacterium]|nr:transcription termination/antitermination protein NusA [Candidatus Peregrinibacteria bacterium]
MFDHFYSAVRQLCEEKKLPEEVIMDIVKAALRTAYRKDYGNKEQNIDVIIDPKTETVSLFLVKQVVDKVEDEDGQISLEEAKKLNKSIKVGEEVRTDVTPLSYGRIAAQSAKQVIIQRIQEAERDTMYELFKDRENELVNALVHRVEQNSVYLELGGVTALLPANEQIPTERYYGGQRIKLYLDKVIKTTKGPQLLISRTHPKLVEKLMELEIPEVKAGTVEVKGVAREPGVRCKVAVHSKDEQVDPIGACVGQNGVRVQSVTQELSGERIDIIPWSANPKEFIVESLKPAKISGIEVSDTEKRAKVYVNQDQRALAIGKGGQNVRLASILTGWEIDIMDSVDAPATVVKTGPAQKPAEAAKVETVMVTSLGLPEEIIAKLSAVNLEQVEQLRGLSIKDFMSVEGITEAEATQIVEAVKSAK